MNTNAVYMIGNGRMAAALRGGDHIQVFGPPYSSPSLFASALVKGEYSRSAIRHLPSCGIWQMDLQFEGGSATVTDFALAEENCLVRHIESSAPVCMRLLPLPADGSGFHYVTVEQWEQGTAILFKSKNGQPIYNDYPLPFPQFFNLLVRGDASVEPAGPFTYDITVHGSADILLVGGPSYPACDTAARRIAGQPYKEMLAATERWWADIFADITPLRTLPQDLPDRNKLLSAIEDTVINLTVQQAAEGGVLAGYAYHLGYVRDQYGVCMGMLKLGMYRQARQMLHFYLDVYRQNGKILNAQGMGVKGLFHFAENDATEITGYLLLQFFRYAAITGDTALLAESGDFLQWLYGQQVGQLHNGTLPFNGDETYIAGGLLPRDVINEGSAEATMLFLLSGRALLAWLRQQGSTDSAKSDEMQATLDAVESGYSSHFVREGRYTLNDPQRLEGLQQPPYRYGVCMNLGKEGCDFFGWTRQCEDGVYLCPCCWERRDIPVRRKQLYHLPSALLMSTYLDAHLLEERQVTDYLRQLVSALERDGHIYSDEQQQKNVGYDYGLLLYNLVKYGLPGQQLVYQKLLSLIDEAGAWSEYYIADAHAGTRYRPWESAINIDALLEFAQRWQLDHEQGKE